MDVDRKESSLFTRLVAEQSNKHEIVLTNTSMILVEVISGSAVRRARGVQTATSTLDQKNGQGDSMRQKRAGKLTT